jgi:hypothetical protein
VLQQLIFAWQYTYLGNPEKAKESIMGIMTVARIFKNLFFFPIESVVITLFLKVLVPVTSRAKLTYDHNANLSFSKKQIATLGLLLVFGVGCAVGYLTYRYTDTSRSADYTDSQRVEANKGMTELVLEKTDDWDNETVVCIVDSAFRPMFEDETDYTVSVYVLDKEAFAKGVEATKNDKKPYSMDTLWLYSKSGPSKDKYQSLIKVASVKIQKNEKTGQILAFDLKALQ